MLLGVGSRVVVSLVGLVLGNSEGNEEGLVVTDTFVGLLVGRTDGIGLGDGVGRADGTGDGNKVGKTVGDGDGLRVGVLVGIGLGFRVGFLVGSSEYAQ